MAHSAAALPITPGGQSHIGGILLEMKKLTQIDIERILRAQEKDRMRFGETARAMGLVTDADIARALARQFGYSYLQEGEGHYPAELVAAYDPFGEQAEILRGVRTHLFQHWFSQGRTAPVIAGIMEGEGTSLFAANLAVTFSQLGQRTELIDANLRRPRQHEIFNLKIRQGLSDILADRAGMETFSKVDTFHHLSVLPAGTRPPNPQELINRPSFGELSRSLAGRFDVILVDAPACSSGADAITIARAAGGVVLVSRKDKTRLQAVQAASRQIAISGAQLVGSVMTNF